MPNQKLKIYVTHTTSFDFENKLYAPLRKSIMNSLYDIVFPHDDTEKPTNSKLIIQASDLILAEVSYPSTGQGIELGWAEIFSIPIVCMYQKSKHYSSSLTFLTKKFIEYSNQDEMIDKLDNFLKEFNNKNCKKSLGFVSF